MESCYSFSRPMDGNAHTSVSGFWETHQKTLYLVKDNVLVGPLRWFINSPLDAQHRPPRRCSTPMEDLETRLGLAWAKIQHISSHAFRVCRPHHHEIIFLFEDEYTNDLLDITLIQFNSATTRIGEGLHRGHCFCLQAANCFFLPHQMHQVSKERLL
jgi:hypothetical protein